MDYNVRFVSRSAIALWHHHVISELQQRNGNRWVQIGKQVAGRAIYRFDKGALIA